ncbi:MAG TPA: fused MFS/spermidine synthase [Phycisphaerae bacterium]|nr:fused MFS/spermidine synthase [Phycisphaerae bacterium]
MSLTWITYLLFLLSGATGLVYEVVWTRQLVFLLGGTTYAITTVLVAFMSGLALGSWLSGRLGQRLRRPGCGYGLLEIAVGLYALVVPVLLQVADPLYRTLYPHVSDSPGILTALRFCVGALVLLIPSTCMGATLPMLVRYIARGSAGLGQSAGLLYGINTCGAVAGTLLAGFVLIPQLGLRTTTWATAAVNVAIGLIALAVLRGEVTPGVERPDAELPSKPTGRKPRRKTQEQETTRLGEPVVTADVRQTVLAVAGLSGFAAMVYQIAWTRALIMSLGSSTYAFTCILAAFILGLGVGSLAVARWVDRWSRPVLYLALLELGIGVSAMLILPIHGQLPSVVHELVSRRHHDYASLLRAEFALVIAVTFVPTFLMGAIFPLAVRLVGTSGDEAGSAVGLAYAVNTVGTILGSFLAGFVFIRGDVLGIQNSIVAAALINVIAAAWLLTKSGPGGTRVNGHVAVGGLGFVAVLVLYLVTGQWQYELLTSGPYIYRGGSQIVDRKLEFFFEDVDTTVSVERIGSPEHSSLTLSVNGKADASNSPADLRTQLLVGHLPALLDRTGKKACIIGLGSGMTLGSVARYPSYEQIDCVEISEGVIAASAFFKDEIYDVLNDPRVRLLRADGRNHLLLTDEQYDLIVSEPSNPWLAGISNLFTREFFELCRARLTRDGVFAVWLQSYSTSQDSFRMVIRTLFEVFDSVSIWEAGLNDYCLIAWNGPRRLTLQDVAARFEPLPVQQDLYRVSLRELGSVLGNYVTGGDRLRQWVQAAPVHTDDNALLEFRAPWDLYNRPHVEISAALVALQQSPLGHLIEWPGVETSASSAPATASLPPIDRASVQRHVETTQQARLRRVAAMQQWEKGDLNGVENLIAAYEADPGNFLIFHLLMVYQGELEETPDDPTCRRLSDRIDSLPQPPVAPAGGATREQMVGIIKTLAVQAQAAKNPAAAKAYLDQARELSPDDPEIARMLEALSTQPASH